MAQYLHRKSRICRRRRSPLQVSLSNSSENTAGSGAPPWTSLLCLEIVSRLISSQDPPSYTYARRQFSSRSVATSKKKAHLTTVKSACLRIAWFALPATRLLVALLRFIPATVKTLARELAAALSATQCAASRSGVHPVPRRSAERLTFANVEFQSRISFFDVRVGIFFFFFENIFRQRLNRSD